MEGEEFKHVKRWTKMRVSKRNFQNQCIYNKVRVILIMIVIDFIGNLIEILIVDLPQGQNPRVLIRSKEIVHCTEIANRLRVHVSREYS